ncbi:MAG TPA: sigma-54-dependent Fis family transcriptional regulator [Bacteroidetes bacterium]|nr:sigma-54-dependent Fis family transcriptional regulator [Bacteroidota bacterium]
MKATYRKIWQDLLRRFPGVAEEPENILEGDLARTAQSAAIQPAVRTILRLQGYDSPVCLVGEKGTGKEFWARVIHTHSRRAKGPFLTVDLETIPPRHISAFLFGPGRRNGVMMQPQEGKIWQAQGGTIYLHGIEHLTEEAQGKLLLLLQHGYGRNGNGNGNGQSSPPRIVVGTEADLEQQVASGKFRKDLFFRLTVFPIALPPLRERKEDLPHLTLFFLRRYAPILEKRARLFDASALDWMTRYFWPGNLDELREFVILNLHFAPENAERISFRLLPEILMRSGASVVKPETARKRRIEMLK